MQRCKCYLRSVQKCPNIVISSQGPKCLYTYSEAVLTTGRKRMIKTQVILSHEVTYTVFKSNMLPCQRTQLQSEKQYRNYKKKKNNNKNTRLKYLRSLNTSAFGPPASWVFKQTHKHTCSSVKVKGIKLCGKTSNY